MVSFRGQIDFGGSGKISCIEVIWNVGNLVEIEDNFYIVGYNIFDY